MSTAAEIAHSLIVLGSSRTRLGVRATVALYLGEEEVFCDEVRLWKARSREVFIKGCLKILNIEKEEAGKTREKIDKWLREQNANTFIFGELKWTP